MGINETLKTCTYTTLYAQNYMDGYSNQFVIEISTNEKKEGVKGGGNISLLVKGA